MKIGDEVYVHGFIDEIRQNTVIIRNDGGYFGTVPSEVADQEETLQNLTKPNKSDLISRQAAIEAICEDGTMFERQGQYSITMAERKQRDTDILDALPSAQPFTAEQIQTMQELESAQIEKAYELGKADRPTGHWIRKQEKHQTAVCSNCEKVAIQELWGTTLRYYDFCPNCGARMESEE